MYLNKHLFQKDNQTATIYNQEKQEDKADDYEKAS